MELLAEVATPAQVPELIPLATDFDCEVASIAAAIAVKLHANVVPHCTPLPITLPAEAVSLALGREARIRVTLADSSGGGSFVVRLRGGCRVEDWAPTNTSATPDSFATSWGPFPTSGERWA
jgi:hypothetical protein